LHGRRPHGDHAARCGRAAALETAGSTFGDELDALAIDFDGRVLLIEIKPGSQTAVEARRLLADDEDTEELTDAIQRFVAIATPVVRIAARGVRFTRVPWVLVTSTGVSLGVTVRNGVRELQAIAALLAHRLEDETGGPPDLAVVQKLTLELYLNLRRTPDVSDLGLTVAALARRWIVSGALGRSTREKTEKALAAAESVDLSSLVPLPRPRGR
jgi:hypothetical protein